MISARLGLEGRRRSALEPDERVRHALAEQPPDRLEVEPVGLHLADEPQPLDVLGPVVAGARPHVGRREQPARLVVADVAHRHARLVGELFDRQLPRFGGVDGTQRAIGHRRVKDSGV